MRIGFGRGRFGFESIEGQRARKKSKVSRWVCWSLGVALALRFYVVQEWIAALAFFAIAFVAIAFLIASLYLLQKSWETLVERLVSSKQLAQNTLRTKGWPRWLRDPLH